MKTALLVLGAHRSGTSPLTRVLNLLGADLPTRLLPPTPANALGFWEPADVVSLHDELLASAGTSWDDWRRFNPAWYDSPSAEAYRQRLLAWLARDLGGSTLFVIKDPRMCRLFRLWRETLAAFDARIKVVITVRNPVEVALSLEARDGFPQAKSYLLWLRNILDAFGDTRDVSRCVVSYEALLRDWRKTVIEITQQLDLTWPRPLSAVEEQVDQFISPRERHHVVEDDEWPGRRDIPAWVKRAYSELRSMTVRNADDAAQTAMDALAAEFDTAIAALAPLLAERKEEGRLSAEIAAQGQHLVAMDHQMRRLVGEAEERERQIATADSEVRRLVREATERERQVGAQVAGLIADIRGRDGRLKAADGELHRLLGELDERHRRLVAADGELRRLIVEVGERDRKLLAADGELRQLIAAVAERDQRLSAADHELRLTLLGVARREDELAAVERQLAAAERDRDRLGREVEARERRLDEIEKTALWRMIGVLRRLSRRRS